MKNLKVVMLAALAVTGLASCGGPKECETHTDNNHDGVCEVCGKTGLPVNHVDENPKDHKCDVCGKVLSECADSDNDHKCDYCGATMSECKDENPKDHKCDVCGKVLSECVDNNHDSYCDICGKGGMEVHHKDENHDNKCDVCGIDIICESYKLDTAEATLVYSKGAEFSVAGVKVLGTFTDETVRELEFTASEPDMSSVGKKEVVVTFMVNGVEKTLSYDIEVVSWTDDELEFLNEYTLTGYGDALPYIVGMYLDFELNSYGQITSWAAVKDGATDEEIQEYWELFNEYECTSVVQGTELTLKMSEYELSAEEIAAFGYEEAYAFRLAPLMEGKYGPTRAFVNDEYFIIGFDGERLEVTDKFVPAYFDGFMADADEAVDVAYDIALILENEYTVDMFYDDLKLLPYYYFSEIAEDYFIFPSTVATTGMLTFYSLIGNDPFNPSYDGYDLAFLSEICNGEESDRTAYVEKLQKAGFATEDGKLFTIENEFIGLLQIYVRDYDPEYMDHEWGQGAGEYFGYNQRFGFELYYTAPENYVSIYMPETKRVMEGFGDLPEYVEYDGEAGFQYAGFYVVAGESTLVPEDVFAQLVSLLPEDYYPGTELEYDDSYECYCQEFTNGYVSFEMDVYEPDSDGDVAVELYFGEGYDTLNTFMNKLAALASDYLETEITPTEAGDGLIFYAQLGTEGTADAIVDTLYKAYVSSGLIASGAEVTDNEDGSFSVYTQSSDGDYDVEITVYYSDAAGSFVGYVYIESSAPWVGTAEEGFAYVATGLGLPEAYWDYLKTEGLMYYSGVPAAQALAAVNATVSAVINQLPKGVTLVSQDYDSETGMNIFTAVSADGLITFEIQVGAFYDDDTHATICTVIIVNVFDTPAE